MPRHDLATLLAGRAAANPNAEALDTGDAQTFAVRCNCPACMKGAAPTSYAADHVSSGVTAAPALEQGAHAALASAPLDQGAAPLTDASLGLDAWQIGPAPHDSLFGF